MYQFEQLTEKLEEIFQTNRADLDFGIYRILNSRADKISEYLHTTLPQKVSQAFASANQEQITAWQNELQEAQKQAAALGIDPENSPKVQQLLAQITQAQKSGNNSEATVFAHLHTFFSRYYDEGDFISQRRYKGNTYAIPYNGEEVLLHWANKDQYYTKSGENFSNYRFKLDDGRQVFFRLIAADSAKDNRKDNNSSRLFTLVSAKQIEKYDDDGALVQEQLTTFKEDGQQLEIFFEYAVKDKKEKQIKENERTLAQLKAQLPETWQAVWQKCPTAKNENRTLLEKHLTDYTQKNNADYFIHKNLGEFLRRELDFYIKNEVINLDNIQHATAFAQIESSLRQIQILREIGNEIIAFLAQLEDFQKSLWLKKKFIAQSYYLLTLDRIPTNLLSDVFANEKQLQEWKNLFNFNEIVESSMGGGNFISTSA